MEVPVGEKCNTEFVQISIDGPLFSLSGGAIAGLVIGLLALSFILLFALWWYIRRRRNQHMRGARSNVAGHLEPELATKPETSFPNPFPEVSGPVLYASPPVESRLIGGPAAPSYDASFTTDVASTRRTSVTMSDFRSDASSRYVRKCLFSEGE